MVKVCTRCHKTHSGPQSFLLTCFGCEKTWHHRTRYPQAVTNCLTKSIVGCHQPPVPDSELVARIKAFTDGDIENGLDGWTCRRCVKRRGKGREIYPDQIDVKPNDLQKTLGSQTTGKKGTTPDGKGSVQPGSSDPHGYGIRRDESTLSLRSDPSSNENVKPFAVPGIHPPTSVQNSAHISSTFPQSNYLLPDTTSVGRKSPKPPDIAHPPQTALARTIPPEPTSSGSRRPSTSSSPHIDLSRVTRTPSAPSIQKSHTVAGSISIPLEIVGLSMSIDPEEGNLPNSRPTIKLDASVRTHFENASVARSHSLSDSHRSTTRDVSNDGEIQTTPRHGTPPSADMDVDDDDDFYWDPPAERVRHHPQAPPRGLEVVSGASFPEPEALPLTPTLMSSQRPKDALAPAWMQERRADTGEDSWDRALRRKSMVKEKPHSRCKPLARRNEGYRIWDLLYFSIDDWIRVVK